MAIRRIGVAGVTAAISAAFLLLTCGVVLAQGTAPTRPPYRLNQLTTQLTHTFPCNPTGGTAALQACTLQSYFNWSGSTLGINTMVGDTGSGGAVGLVPAPAAGDAAAGKYLSAAGTYSAPAGGGGGSGTVNSGTAGQLGYYATSSTAISGNANATISSGALTMGQAGSIVGKLLLSGNTSGAVTIQPQAAAGTYNFNLPTSAGSAGQPMLSGGGVAAAMTFGTLSVGGGGTGLTGGTSGGIPYFSSTSAMSSSAALTAHGVVLGSGAGSAPTTTTAGTAGQVLTSNGSSLDPTFQAGAGAALTTTDGTHNVTSTTSQTYGNCLLVGGSAGAATIDLTQKPPNSQTGGDYTIATTDACGIVEGGVHTYTYALGTLGAGFGTLVQNVGTSGNMTLSSTGGNFTGLGVANALSFTLAPGESAYITSIAGPLGLVQKAVNPSVAAVSNQWIDSIVVGVPHLSQPAFTNISGAVASSQLPNPSASTLGGVESKAAVTHQFLNQISTSGVPGAAQPDFADLTGTATNAQLPATALATGTSVSLTAPRQYYVCTGTCTVTPPVPAAGYEFCVMNDDAVTGVITLAALGSSARYEAAARTSYGTAGTGTFVSAGAAGDKVCLLGRDATHYLTVSFNGTWTAN